ncbi:hypothetical protein GLOIN_2v1543751 [Rhizophagus clarus]|uniref:MIR domain-containing protein n=1 Tax=Rhizophagus clarus TaxID=94130 RepID=A0A8H3LZ63_9GLOM|nr:hypothetical protein GLOIN_2v1543751 [Rhizophagus clarus]
MNCDSPTEQTFYKQNEADLRLRWHEDGKNSKLCYNAEINDIKEQKKYLYKSLPDDNHYSYFLTEFYKRMENINSMSELIKEFEEVITDEANLNLQYMTESKNQLVFAGNLDLDPNALWIIRFLSLNNITNKELASYSKTSCYKLQHKISGKQLGVLMIVFDSNNYDASIHNLSPSSSNIEDNHQGYLKSNDIINLIIDNLNGRYYDPDRFLCSHDIHFTIGKDAFQEVVCHNKTTRINDEWYIELIKNV